MHSPSRLRHLWEIVEGSCHASATEQNLCRLLHLVSCMPSFSSQLLALSEHSLSRCYAPAAYPECRHPNTTAISRRVGMHALAIIPSISHNCHHWSSPCQSINLYENLTSHVAHSYCIKLQHQEYKERCTTDIWKTAIKYTSVELAHARLNYKEISCIMIFLVTLTLCTW